MGVVLAEFVIIDIFWHSIDKRKQKRDRFTICTKFYESS